MRVILGAAVALLLAGCTSPPGHGGGDELAPGGRLVAALDWARMAADDIYATLRKAREETITGEQAVSSLVSISEKAKADAKAIGGGSTATEWIPVLNEAQRVLSGVGKVAEEQAGRCRIYGGGPKGCGQSSEKPNWGGTGTAFDRAAFLANGLLGESHFTRPLGPVKSPCAKPIEGAGQTSGDDTACAYVDVVNNSSNTTAFFICRLVRYGNADPQCNDTMTSGRLKPNQSWLKAYRETSPLACGLGKEVNYRLGFDPANPREIVLERIAHHFDFTFKCSYPGSFNLTTLSIGPGFSVGSMAQPRGCRTFGSYWECERP
ncbi:MAG TPA: hypothetical protein VM327_08110 [Candidatus Thermoplasmatota archaeon]|nr:hypothetical protein [Candidatus Thermoplasmatota archaeon]